MLLDEAVFDPAQDWLLTLSSTADDLFQLWQQDPDFPQEEMLPVNLINQSRTWQLGNPLDPHPETLWLDALAAGQAELELELKQFSTGLTKSDEVRVTILDPEIDVFYDGIALEDESETTHGAFVHVNDDDDDDDGIVDYEDPVVEGGDDDLLEIKLFAAGPNDIGGQYTLTFSDEKIRLWQNPDRTEAVISGVTTFDAYVDTPLYLEGIAPPEGPSNEMVSLNFTAGNVSWPAADEIVAHVVKLEFLTFDSETGEVFSPDEIAAGDFRPQVDLNVTDATITAGGQLSVTVTAGVNDRLSQLAPEAADRVQQLAFYINHELVESIADLPSLSTAGTSEPWTPYPFGVDVSRTFLFDLPFRPFVLRAETSPNAAGVMARDLVGVTVEYQEITEEFSSLDPNSLWNETPPTVNPQTGEELQGRRYLGAGYPAGSYVTRPGGGEDAQVWGPVDVHVEHFDGTQPNDAEPMAVRIDGLDESSAEFVDLELDGETTDVLPFVFSPKKFYVADKIMGKVQIFVVTPRTMTPELEEARAGNIQLAWSGGELEAGLKTSPTASSTKIDAKINVLEHDLGDPPTTGWFGSNHTTMQQLLSWFELLYGETGQKLLHYYQQGQNTIELGDVWLDYDVDGWIAGNGSLVIQIEEDTTPMAAAGYLWQGLLWTRGYYRGEIPVAEWDLLMGARQQAAAVAGEITAAATHAYLSGLGIVNEGADFVMTLSEVSEGNYAAAIGLLPLVPAAVYSAGGKAIVKLPGGQVLSEFTQEAAEKIGLAAKETTFSARWAHIEPLNLPIATRLQLVKAGILPIRGSRGQTLANNLIADGFPKPTARHVAHHDLAWFRRDWFAAHGLDVDDAAHGRWVVGGPGADHTSGTLRNELTNEWKAFISVELAEKGPVGYSKDEILAKMNELKGQERFKFDK